MRRHTDTRAHMGADINKASLQKQVPGLWKVFKIIPKKKKKIMIVACEKEIAQ